MRIRRLDLTRYGRFTNHSIDFGAPEAGKPDFHLIVGANEAGKSTLTAAIVDLLFGMGQRSPYGFLHGYDGMQIGAALELPSGEREVVRVKRGARLRDASGQAIDEGILTAGLSGIDREAYRMMFCLDEETLRMGGESILASQGELGQLLFSASAGLAAFGQRLSKLQEIVDAFHKPRGRSTELSAFKARLDELKARKEAINVLATTHAQLVLDRDDASAKYEAALSERSKSKLRFDEINRYLGVLPDLVALKGLRLDLSALAEVPQPPAAWAERLPELIGAEGRIKAACEIASANVDRIRRERDGIQIEQVLIDAGPAIDALRNSEARYVAALDISKRESELAVIEGNLKKISERLDHAGELPAKLVLPATLVGKLRGLIDRRSGLRERLQAASRECIRASDALSAAKQVLASLDATDQDEVLAARVRLALDQARASDHAAREKAALRVIIGLQDKLKEQLNQLGSWNGDLDQLAAMKAPTTHQIEDWRRRGEVIRQASVKHASDIESLTDRMVELAATITSIKAATGLVDDATARTSRVDRDDAWRTHREVLSEATAAVFEAALRNDDGITETRLSQTSLAADLRQAVQAEATTAAKLRRAEQLHTDTLALKAGLDAELAATFIVIGLPSDAHVADLERLLMRRASALEISAQIEVASADLRTAQEDGAAHVERLAAALKSIGVLPSENEFANLLVGLQTAIDRRTTLRSELSHAAKSLEQSVTELATRQRDVAEAQAAQDDWQQEWDVTVKSCWLSEVPSPLGPDEVSQVLNVLAEIPPLESERESLSHRIAAMKRDQDQFIQAVSSVASSLQIPADEDDPVKLAADLRRRLETARSHERDRRSKTAELERAVIVNRDALEELTLHRADVETHTSFFGVASLMEVSAKIDEANRRSELERQLKVLSSRITAACRTETLEAAEAILAEFEQTGLEAEAASLASRLEGQDREAHELHARHLQADRALAAIGGDDAVARLDEERRTVLVELEEKAVQYARLKLGIAAAHQALQIYRDTHRTSMLQHASDAYRTITMSAYSGLATQPNGDKEILLGVMAGGGSKLATEMSTGARAQLYLALRIAGYHEFAKTRPSLPFIADDILETFDDFRSEEACRLFGGMATSGQVIVATHHHHLIDIALRACSDVTVHQLVFQ